MSTRAEAADTAGLERCLIALAEQLPGVRHYRIAASGGLDSTVLLHLCAQARERIGATVSAVHVDHGLQPASAEWARHCEALCARLDVPFLALRVDARPARGESPEAAARAARYAALAPLIGDGDCLLTAHHEDDQAETVLLQLLRGAGPHGLAAMPAIEHFGGGWHARPLLACARDTLHAHALRSGLRWIDDPSNADTGYRRNYLRHEILPRLKSQWPAAARTLARAARHAASAAVLLDTLADQDLDRVAGRIVGTLSVTALTTLGGERQANALRRWLHRLDLPLPTTAQLERLRVDVLGAAADAMPRLCWPGAEIRRYRNDLYGMRPLAPQNPRIVLAWDLVGPLTLPDGGRLLAHPARGATDRTGGLRPLHAGDGPLTVRFRHGGERCRPAGRGGSRAVKRLLQDAGIPPWLRDRVPMLYAGESLVAIAGVCVCAGWRASPEEGALTLEWQPGR